jgi:putative DNA primase/helicase
MAEQQVLTDIDEIRRRANEQVEAERRRYAPEPAEAETQAENADPLAFPSIQAGVAGDFADTTAKILSSGCGREAGLSCRGWTMINLIDSFKQTMQNAGIEPPGEIIADGVLHRFTVAGDRARSDNGWYVLHADDPAAGAFGCWKRGIAETWSSKACQVMTPAEKTAYTAKMEAMKRQREEERKRIQTECRVWCADAWAKAKNATNDNPYLKSKGVNAYGLKAFGENLLVPLQDMAKIIHGLQFISPDGTKKFKTGTNKAGHFFKIGKSKDKTVIICEGYATGASIHQTTGHAVVIAFDSGNLLPVAQNIRAKYPDMKIIIATDDDHTTEGNPGLTKATEATRAVSGLLATPVFPENRGPKDTDFNDLARLAGPEAVRACIDGAAMPIPTPTKETTQQANHESQENLLDAAIQRLAALSPMQYDVVRKAEAKSLGVRPPTLDAAVKEARKGGNTDDLPFTEVEPWPEPIDPATLLTDIATTIRRFIVCCEEVSHAVALWIAMTWFIAVVQIAPLAVITSPEKRCGKTQLMSLLGRLSARAITASNISPSALFRAIDAWNPTLLIDEADSFMKDNEEMRGLLNSGHTRDSAYVIRTVGESFTPTKFNTWGAKALAGIGHVADTLMDRAIILELRRRLPHEKVKRIRQAEPHIFDDLSSKLARFAEDYSEEVRQARPPLPNSLNDRAQDNWEPLLAIAMTASDEWLEIGTKAALTLSGGEMTSPTVGTELLADIQVIFKEKNVDRIATAVLIEALCSDDEKPWKTYGKGFPITPRQLANTLKPYGIHSKSIRIGDDTAKGYVKDHLTEAFSRYIPSPPSASVTASQSAPAKDLRAFQSVTQADVVTVSNRWKPTPVKECDGVTVETLPSFPIDNLREVAL